MDALNSVRNFGASNRGMIVNVVYIVAILVILYFLVQFYLAGSSQDKMLLDNKLSATLPSEMAADYVLTIADSETSSDVRIKNGGEYTLSYWMYIQNWQAKGTNGNIDVLAVTDSGLTDQYVLACSLYANEPKMMIRAGGVGDTSALKASYPGTSSTPGTNMPMCDVMDIDLQRWIHVTISMNGRIMDVYLDGKLARSCILPSEQKNISSKGTQTVLLAPKGGFKGYFSGVQFSAYAVTPDQIYARYLAGPYSSRGFMDFIKEKIGISITYKYAGQSTTAT
jgi:hypothetical protein